MADSHNIAMALRSAYWAMHRQADALLGQYGVTTDQFVLLSLLDDENGITQMELVRRASSDPNTVRAMLVLLEAQGLVSRRPHQTDGRALSITLTRKGRRRCDHLWVKSESFRERLIALFNPAETKALIRQLTRIAKALAPVPARRRTEKRKAARVPGNNDADKSKPVSLLRRNDP